MGNEWTVVVHSTLPLEETAQTRVSLHQAYFGRLACDSGATASSIEVRHQSDGSVPILVKPRTAGAQRALS